jgi:preprotein translocase subunit SecA
VAYKRESFDMFEGMMTRFQEDTVRYLFLMQIVGPDGRPVAIPTRPRPAVPAAPPVASADGHAPLPAHTAGNGHHTPPPPALPGRDASAAPSTTIDSIEREFQRKKQRELQHARMAGGGEESRQVSQRRAGEKIGRNDPCPCGSGKKYKKCHGAEEA